MYAHMSTQTIKIENQIAALRFKLEKTPVNTREYYALKGLIHKLEAKVKQSRWNDFLAR
jgi:hypothetical protein